MKLYEQKNKPKIQHLIKLLMADNMMALAKLNQKISFCRIIGRIRSTDVNGKDVHIECTPN